jgi:cyclophilin family peptidyl-prolyl cis-trans isomerase
LILVLVAACCTAGTTVAKIARFNTSIGLIDVRLYEGIAPLSVTNFNNYVTSGRYNATFIHRVPQRPQSQGGGTANFVVQGGGFRLNSSIFAASGITTDAPIADEFRGISNTEGTIAFAKNSLGATSQWFFNIGNNSGLDAQGFTVFGRVVGGWQHVNTINNLTTANFSNAQNAPGEDFDEIPVTNITKVLAQNDITRDDAVMVNAILYRNLPDGDYNFNTVVDMADYEVWRRNFGSTTNAAADGNGNGIVDAADYLVWRNTLGQTTTGGAGSGAWTSVVPEPSAAVICLVLAFVVAIFRPLHRRK